MAIIAKSINTVINNVGIVIFVGIAARFVIRLVAIAAIAKGQKIKLFPVARITATVMIVNTHP